MVGVCIAEYYSFKSVYLIIVGHGKNVPMQTNTYEEVNQQQTA